MGINWKVRLKNKTFWVAIVPAILMLVQVVANLIGYEFDFGEIGNKITAGINAVFGILALLGIVNDPTTAGISDSQQALTYEKPKEE